jgi:hypothetical protein
MALNGMFMMRVGKRALASVVFEKALGRSPTLC